MVNYDSGSRTENYGKTIYRLNFETDDEHLFNVVRSVVLMAHDNDVMMELYAVHYGDIGDIEDGADD